MKDESVGWIFAPRYSPDGRSVAVYWNHRAGPGIWIITLADHSETRVFEGLAMPAGWSPDGKWVYILEGSPARIHAVPARGGDARLLTTLPWPVHWRRQPARLHDRRRPPIRLRGDAIQLGRVDRQELRSRRELEARRASRGLRPEPDRPVLHARGRRRHRQTTDRVSDSPSADRGRDRSTGPSPRSRRMRHCRRRDRHPE